MAQDPSPPDDPAGPGSGSFADHFSEHGEEYLAHRPTYPPALAAFLAETAGGTAWAWEAGCGSGQLTRSLAGSFERVLATDLSREQLARAPTLEGVTYRQAPAHRSGLPEQSVDLSVAAQAAHWFPLEDYYREVRRVTRRSGAVALVSYGEVEVEDPRIHSIFREFQVETLSPFWPPERRHVSAGYRTLPFPFPEIPAPELHMEARWSLPQLLGYVETWSAMRALEREGALHLYHGFQEELEAAWSASGAGGEPDPPREPPVVAERKVALRWPLALRVGRLGQRVR